MPANEHQVGGRHYKTDYEHWDLVAIVNMDYFAGNSTKYVSRWRKKNGLQDLQKALHYLDKLIEVFIQYQNPQRPLTNPMVLTEVNNFALANNVSFLEEEYVLKLCLYDSVDDLNEARVTLLEIIEEAEAEQRQQVPSEKSIPGTPEDGGHHA